MMHEKNVRILVGNRLPFWYSITGVLMFVSSLVQVQVKRSVLGREDDVSSENGDPSHLTKPFKPLVRKSKLVVVDLAGSERIQKSGVYANL